MSFELIPGTRFDLLRFSAVDLSFSDRIRSGMTSEHEGVTFFVKAVHSSTVDSLVEGYRYDKQKQISGTLNISRTPENSSLQDSVRFVIRTESKLLLVGTGDNPLLLEWCLDFFSTFVGVDPDYAPVDRRKVKDIVERTKVFQVEVETPRGARNIEKLGGFKGDPLLSYDLASAMLMVEFMGQFEVDLTLESIVIDPTATPMQKEYALQLVEQYML